MKFKKLRSVIIDDSSTQRMAISKMVKNHLSLDLVAEFKNGIEAQREFKKLNVDLIFLDIEMPIVNGFEFIEALENPPQIILITGKPDYALKAFDYDVTDYLLKPITQNRFYTSIKKALANDSQTNMNSNEEEDHIYVNSSLKKVKIIINDIKWVEGLGDYVKIVSHDSNVLVLSTMKAFITKLPKDKFLRVHKSYIVNLTKVEKFSSVLIEVAGEPIPLSRYKKNELEEALLNNE